MRPQNLGEYLELIRFLQSPQDATWALGPESITHPRSCLEVRCEQIELAVDLLAVGRRTRWRLDSSGRRPRKETSAPSGCRVALGKPQARRLSAPGRSRAGTEKPSAGSWWLCVAVRPVVRAPSRGCSGLGAQLGWGQCPARCKLSSWLNRASTSSSSNFLTPVRAVTGAPLMKQSAGGART